MRKFLSLALLISFTFYVSKSQINDLLFRRISPADGFTFGSIRSIDEDQNGFIWFAAEDGLYRYNSRSIDKYIHKKDDPYSIPANNIYSVFNDKAGKLWIGSVKGLSFFDEEREIFITPEWKLPFDNHVPMDIRSIIENSDGKKVILSDLVGIFQLNEQEDSIIPIILKFEAAEDYPTEIIFDNNQNLCIGTKLGYFYRSAPPYKEFSIFYHNRKDKIQAILQDNNTYWIGYELSGIDHINDLGTIIDTYQKSEGSNTRLPNNSVRSIAKDRENRIWIGTYKGLAVINKRVSTMIQKTPYNYLPHNSVHSLKTDSKGGVWIGTWSGGLAHVGKHDIQFTYYQLPFQSNALNNHVISSFEHTHDGDIWISTEDGGLNRFNRKEKTFDFYKIRTRKHGTVNIKTLCFDEKNTLWIGAYANGLWSFNIDSKKFTHHNIFPAERISIYTLCLIGNTLWMGSWGDGIYSYNITNGELINYISDPADSNSVSSDYIRCIVVDSYEGLWIGTQSGLNYKPKGSDHFKRFFFNTSEKENINHDEIYSVLEDSNGNIWIGTGGNGLDILDPETGKLTNISKTHGLPGNNVYGVLEDNKGNFWISTENGITCYTPELQKFKYYNKDDGLQGDQFKPNAAFKTKNGEFLFGGSNGFNLFNPDLLSENPIPPTVFITNLEINNKKVTLSDPDSPLKKAIHTVHALKLKPRQNSLSLEFVANNFIQPYKNRFKYRMLNYQNDWIDSGTEGKATFTMIPPGSYTFEVWGSNNDGVWSLEPARLKIDIQYPFWKSKLAYLIYLSLLIFSIWLIRREIIFRQQLKNEILIEKVQRENEEKLHQLKLQIFTNISHEFRTPLTLILSPLEMIIDKKYYDNDTKEHLAMIQRNAQRLRMLINQIIDFRKLELNKIEYSPLNTDVIALCLEVCNHFRVHAKDKAISFTLTSAFNKYELEADPDKLDKIVFNLLSNAFKFTPEGGDISLKIEEAKAPASDQISFSTFPELTGQVLAIRVANSGKGIANDEIPRIFERFYKSPTGTLQGAGIGLHLCREYTKLHQGAITVENRNEKGTVFSVLLPLKARGTISESNNLILERWSNESPDTTAETLTSGDDVIVKKDYRYAVLVVEDNHDMRKQIHDLLKNDYKVILASNGTQGFEIAKAVFPDIIISDVIMPGINGLDFCKQVKEDFLTSHIPVILLTALSETDNQISGLETGADAYIVKPFNNELLQVQIKNLIASREQLKKIFSVSSEKWADDKNLTLRDKNLIDKSFQIIETHLLDSGFSVEQLSALLGISRSSLHRKMKALTNQSANEFIRYVRLKKAIKLMKDGDLNIDEIGFAVGFNSHSYFSQCFKKQYGVTPSVYVNEIKLKRNEFNDSSFKS